MLKISNIHKSFGDLEVLKGVNLDVAEGEVLCLMGPSGSGKSTLLRCINHLEDYGRGTITLDGKLFGRQIHKEKLQHVRPRALARQRSAIGIVFQEFHLFPHMTALQNVMTGPMTVLRKSRAQSQEIAERLLERVGLIDKCAAHPSQLSGGQKQRVAIARALAMQPRLMLFDEPTSALDPELVGEVLGVMRELALEGMTMVIVTHEVGFTERVADRVAIFHSGSIVEEGPPLQVLQAPSHPLTRRFLGQIKDEVHTQADARSAASPTQRSKG